MKRLIAVTLVSLIAGAAVGIAGGLALADHRRVRIHVDVTRPSWVVGAVILGLLALVATWKISAVRFREVVTWLVFAYQVAMGLVLGILVLSLSSPAKEGKGATSVHLIGTGLSLKHLDATTVRLILLVSIGALGGLVHVLWTFVGRVGGATFLARWGWWYLTGPFFGAAAAYALTLALGRGLVRFAGAPDTTVGQEDLTLLAFGAFVAGLFSKTVLERLGKLLPVPNRSSAPAITQVTPSTLQTSAIPGQQIQLHGRGFTADTAVYVDGTRVPTLDRDTDVIRFTVDVPAEPTRPLALRVANEIHADTSVLIERA